MNPFNVEDSKVTISPSEQPNAVSALPLNKIAIENLKHGNPESEWGISGDGTGNIQGFTTDISRNIGQTIDFKIATSSTNYRLDIYRMGYYNGDGARKVATVEQHLTTAQIQPHPVVDMSLGLIDCGNWSVSASWAIPPDAVSGVYFAKLVREDGVSGESIVPFIVRDDAASSDIVFQTSDTTWQAYNAWGGASLYYGQVPVDPANMVGYMPPNCSCGLTAIGRASAVSYNRPIITNTSPIGGTHDFIFGAESSAIQWIEQNGYDVSYISGVDSARSGSQLLNHQAFLSVGHDEYWSAEQRTNVEAARDAGVNLAFWSGNECYWKVRWENSIDGNGTAYRTMVCYKETWGTSVDPSAIGTGTWRDPRYADAGQEPENSLTGTMFTVDSYRQDAISIPYDYSNLRFWRNTDVAELAPGQTYQLTKNLLGYEWDSDVENGFRPDGLVNLSLSSISVDTYLRDYGTTVGAAVATHSLTMYRAESGALVFGAGTVFWSWGLSTAHEGAATPTDPNVQQAMINMFADMGIQPTTLDASLILATASPDHLKPTSTIAPGLATNFVEGQHVSITGTAHDFGGGTIAGVEVSTDGGQRWFKAIGRENWSFNWVVQGSGSYAIMSRAVDDSVNLEIPSAGKQVNVVLPSTAGLWTRTAVPVTSTNLDRESVELGTRFQTTTSGAVTAVRFYKGQYNIGEHNVSLWSADGTRLATSASTVESISGWQTVTFASPVQISAGLTYIASYHSDGYYSSTDGYFNASYANGVLRASADAGVYAYGTAANLFPDKSYNGANYWVDVAFTPSTTNAAPVASNDGVVTGSQNTMTVIPVSFVLANDIDPDGDALSVIAANGATHGTVAFNPQSQAFIFTPTASYQGAANFSYTISDGRGGTSSASVSLTITPPSTATGVFTVLDTPPPSGVNDPSSVELGMKFTASARGDISGLRYYKSAQDTGTHTGSLWSATGTLLGSLTFASETSSGWQSATFVQPVSISAGSTYVASYHSNGNYSATPNYFATTHSNGVLTAPSSSAAGGNGVYAYGTSPLFPTATYNSTNYWVDVLYENAAQNTAPVAVSDSGFLAVAGSPVTIAAAALIANDNDPDNDTISVLSVSSATNGTATFDNVSKIVTFTASAGYAGPAAFLYSISDGHGGTASAQVTLTVAGKGNVTNLFLPGATPTTTSVADNSAVNLGMKFSADTAGWVSGIKFYKGSANVGPHTGYLWSTAGTLLASVTFANESASGWQTADLSMDVAISANTSYVVSYSTNGNYSATSSFFLSSLDNGNLHAKSSALSGGNGVYAYGPGGLFPTSSFNSTNYYVDVAFRPQLAA